MKNVLSTRVPRSFAALAMACSLVGIAAGAAPAGPAPISEQLPSVPRARAAGARFVSGEVLVRFRSGGSHTASLRRVGATSVRDAGFEGWKLVRLPRSLSVADAVKKLKADPAVATVSPNHIWVANSVPNDPLFGLQWALQNTGQTISGDAGTITGTSGDDISATSAWDTTQGSSSTIVAVVDSGVADDVPDLHANMVPGASWVSSSTYDTCGHGTHVAGIIGGIGNDGFGVSGVAQHVSIMPLHVLTTFSGTCSGTTADIASAFAYAAQHGAKVVNASLGGDADPMVEQAIVDSPNTLFVVAAGNSATNNDTTPTYPCNYTLANVVCVAATDQNDQLASFSNYGKVSVGLAAPGENVASTYPPDPAYAGGRSLTDSPNGPYAQNSDSWAQRDATYDLSHASNCSLKYVVRGRLGAGAAFSAEASTDGSSWTVVDSLGPSYSTHGSWISRSPALAAAGQASVHVRFHLVTDGSATDDGIYVDNVQILCSGFSATDDFDSGMGGWSTNGAWATTNRVWTWVYMSGTSMATPFVSGVAALIWSKYPTASVAHVKNAILGSVDLRSSLIGKTVSGGRLNAARALQYAIDTAPPTGVALTGTGITRPFQLGTSFGLGWTATDLGLGVKSFDVQYERAPYNGKFGAWTTWKSGTSTTGATFGSKPGYSYCFRVRARDYALNVSGWSATRCTAFPVNDTSFTDSLGWKHGTSTTRYLGTDTYSSTKGATLTLSGVQFRQLDLVVSMCSTCGSVAVYNGSTYDGTFSLYSSTFKTRQLIRVRSLSITSAATTITLRVVTSGKVVIIEGLGVLRY